MTEIEKLSQVKFNNMHRAYCEAKRMIVQIVLLECTALFHRENEQTN